MRPKLGGIGILYGMAVFVLVGVGLLLAIVDTVSIAVAYSQ